MFFDSIVVFLYTLIAKLELNMFLLLESVLIIDNH